MTVELNHTIVWARDKAASAQFLADILGLPVAPPVSHFVPIHLSNRVTLDYADAADVHPQHYAFHLTEEEFDAAFARIRNAGIDYYADPSHQQSGVINHYNGGRGLYFADANGHNMELLTRA